MYKNKEKISKRKKSQYYQSNQQPICKKCYHHLFLNHITKQINLNLRLKYSDNEMYLALRDINILIKSKLKFKEGLPFKIYIQVKQTQIYQQKKQYLNELILTKYKAQRKLLNLSQYYKYYNTYPLFFQQNIEKIMKDCMYKKKMILYRHFLEKQKSEVAKSTRTQIIPQYNILDAIPMQKKKKQVLPKNKLTQSPEKIRNNRYVETIVQNQKINDKNSKKNVNLKKISENSPEMFNKRPKTIYEMSQIKPKINLVQSQIKFPHENYGLQKLHQNLFKKKSKSKIKKSIKSGNNQFPTENSVKSSQYNLSKCKKRSSNELIKKTSQNKIQNLNSHKRCQSEQIFKPPKSHKYVISSLSKQ